MTRANIDTSKKIWPVCYAYTTPDVPKHKGRTKIGFTERDAETRVKEQLYTPDIDGEIAWVKNAIYEDSSETFRDDDFHRYLVKQGVEKKTGKEWFKIDPKSAKHMFDDFRDTKGLIESDSNPAPYQLRDEQAEAVAMTMDYFRSHDKGEFLWNAKPRFGKTLSSYDLCMKMGFENILIVTNRPAIANSWYDDYKKFVGTGSGYIFVSRVEGIKDEKYVYDRKEFINILPSIENYKGLIEFVSLQDLKGSVHFGGDMDKLKHIKDMDWDILIIDEAHEGVDTYKTDTAFNQITRKNTLHLSGTPFKALANDKFSDDAIYNWTYADEQRAKREWDEKSTEENPYAILPRLNLFTYQMSDVIKNKLDEGMTLDGETVDYAFDLNEFFSTDGRGAFVYNKEVDDFLDALTDPNRTQFPFSTPELRDEIKHSFWLLNRVDSAKALKRKLELNPIFRDYEIVVAAGDGKTDGDESELISEESLTRVRTAIKNHDKTITLSVGQLTTGVTIPEWTAVLMLASVKSPALYMQAAFRSQNPCLFAENKTYYRKKNAYVFDFDPARTLDIFDKFANDLSPNTSGGGGDSNTRKKNIRELLNFFPVYGEDKDGSMVLLDAEKVLSIPRKLKAVDVVNRGFMSNFLFKNIANIFRAPAALREIIDKMNPVKEPKNKKPLPIDDETADDLDLDEEGEVNIPDQKVIGLAQGVFGDKVYGEIKDEIDEVSTDLIEDEEKTELEDLIDTYTEPISSLIVDNVGKVYDDDLNRKVKNNIKSNIKDKVGSVVKKRHGDYEIEKKILENKKKEEIENSKSSAQISSIEKKYKKEAEEKYKELTKHIKEDLDKYKVIEDSAKSTIKIIETDKKEKEKRTIEDDIRDRLRGFSRTIPSFLMAYGDYDTTLDNFDKIIPEDVFLEVTSITVKEFRGLRDGFKYDDPETGEEKFFEGKLFDEVVFDDSIKEFLDKKEELKNYFDEDNKKDIFDYIPPQKTNQVFTPKRVVKKMVDLLEEENPGCFEDPTHTFLDPYMKSGLYIAEIVKRLYNNESMKERFKDPKDRLRHIFSKQVYGLAPTEIIYNIAKNFVLGFSDDFEIKDHKLRLFDSLESIQNESFEKDLEELYPELKDN